jgi:hypothetical protein
LLSFSLFSGSIRFFLEKPISILDPDKVKVLKAEMKRLQPAFLVVDTVAWNFGVGPRSNKRGA